MNARVGDIIIGVGIILCGVFIAHLCFRRLIQRRSVRRLVVWILGVPLGFGLVELVQYSINAIDGGPIVLGGAGLLLLSALLFLAWTFLAVRDCRLSPRLAGVAAAVAVIGYLGYDWRHISLNLSMREAESVRGDCVRLLEHRRTIDQDQRYHEASELPLSFARIGATFVHVKSGNVAISLIPFSGLTGGAWGFLYDPQRAYLSDERLEDIRPTWYRDFYEFRVRGE